MFNIKRKIKYDRGFTFKPLTSGLTLIELMVVISIFLMITSVAIFNYGSFNSNISLQNLTDDIALSIRKAQSFAIGARGIKIDGKEEVEFNKSYGVHFSINPIPSTTSVDSSNQSFLVFSTPTADKKYDSSSNPCGSGGECVEFFNITTADYIKEIAVTENSTRESIGENATVDIVFTRPNPRAYFCYRHSLNDTCETNVSSVDIIISNGNKDKEKFKIISVQNTGQISIQNYEYK